MSYEKYINAKAKEWAIKEAKLILEHLLATGQGFCFVNGNIISRENCENLIKQEAGK